MSGNDFGEVDHDAAIRYGGDTLADEKRLLPELRAATPKDTEIDEMDERLKAIETMRGSV